MDLQCLEVDLGEYLLLNAFCHLKKREKILNLDHYLIYFSIFPSRACCLCFCMKAGVDLKIKRIAHTNTNYRTADSHFNEK